MLITADWVLPISRPPIRNGGVLVKGSHVVSVGRAADLRATHGTEPHRDFPGCVLMPGLVNAHTHLSLTAMEGLLGPAPFDEWLPRLVAAMRAWSHDDYAASAALGALRCLEAGVTVAGDIAYGPESVSAAGDAGLGGTFFWEVLGIRAPKLFTELQRLEFPREHRGACSPRIRCALSPHAPYSSGPALLQLMHETALDLDVPYGIHLAESAAETELFLHGTGPLAPLAQRLADGFESPHGGPTAYLDRLGVLDGATVIHLCRILATDIPRLASTVRGAVVCPRSNAFLSNPLPPVKRLIAAGLPVGIGTDSSASNHDLDVMEELRVLRAHDPSLPAQTLLEMVTAMGAVALGLEDRFGNLEPGMQADCAVFAIGSSDDPVADTVRTAGASCLRALLAGGEWRVLDGKPTTDARGTEASASAAATRAGEALAAL